MIDKATLSMVIGVPLIVLFVATAPSYLKFSPIEINKSEPVVEKKVFDKGNPPAEVGKAESTTLYDFACDPKVDYVVEEETKISDEKYQARLRVTRAKVALRLPVVVWLSQSIDNRRTEFEEGHVRICRRIYTEAQVQATAAAKSTIGRTFFGQGKDAESARQKAVQAAQQEISQHYVEAVDTKAKDLFVIYDFYAPTWRRAPEVLVDKALQDYEMGKPRKLRRL
jgi:hypothetical protein